MKRILPVFLVLSLIGVFLLDFQGIKAGEIANLEDEKSGLEVYLADFQTKMDEINSEISLLNTEIAGIEEDIRIHSELIQQTEEEEAVQYEAMKSRIRFMYEAGEKQYLDIFLSSESISEVVNRSGYISQLVAYDRKMLKKYEETRKTIEDSEKVLQEEKAEIVALREAAKDKQWEVQSSIENTRAEIKKYADEIARLEEEARLREEALRRQQESSQPPGFTGNSGSVENNYAEQAGDLEFLAAIIECEAGGESFFGKLAVGSVVLNRVNSPRFRQNTVYDVIVSPNQFSPVASGRFSLVLLRGANQSCIDAAREVLNGNIVIDKLFFRTVNGASQEILDQGVIIENHVFY